MRYLGEPFFEAKERFPQTPSKKADPENIKYYPNNYVSVLLPFAAKERFPQTPSKKAQPENNKYYLKNCVSVLRYILEVCR